jgi:hypothetical protein
VSFVCISLLSETYLTALAESRAEERRLITEARQSTPGDGCTRVWRPALPRSKIRMLRLGWQ